VNKKYEEMTKEELCKEADEILKRFQISCMGDDSTIWVEDVCSLGKIVKTMKENEINKTVLIHENIAKTLGEFLDRNKEYIVEVYIRNLSTDNIIGRMYITTDRTIKTNDKKIVLEWDNRRDITLNNLSIPYDEVLACYDEVDEYNQHMVFVILKCGVSIGLECVGMRI